MLYDGELNNENVLDGYGRYVSDGNSLEGQFKNHKMHGYVREQHNNGMVKEGYYANHKLHGSGRVIDPNGNLQEGIFQNGLMVKPMMHASSAMHHQLMHET